jgi:hypothetical protein
MTRELTTAAGLRKLADAVGTAEAGGLDATGSLAALILARASADGLERAELTLMDAARADGATWQQIAAAMGARGRSGAQKRHADLSRRHPRPQPAAVSRPAPEQQPGPGVARPRADAVPAPQEATAPPPGPEHQDEAPAARRDARLPGRAGWTIGTSEFSSRTVLYAPDGAVAGVAERAWLGSSQWSARFSAGGQVHGGPWPSRRKALAALADRAERRRREATPAGRVPLAAADGWYLEQTQADRDDGRYAVRRPDGTTAGTIRRSPALKGHWEATAGDPGSALGILTPLASGPGDDGGTAAGDWRTRESAANAVIRWVNF